MIKVVFIDIDNTLLSFDGYVKYCMKEGFHQFGLKEYEPYMFDVFTEENNKLWNQLEKGTLTFEHLEEIRWANIFKRLGIAFDGITFEKYFREQLYSNAIIEEHAYEMVEYLSKKYILCLASNGPYEQQCNRIKIAHLDHFFQYSFISEKFGVSKPSTEFFEKSFFELNENREDKILPEETMIIGDSLSSDMQGGLNYGMHTCYFNRNKKSGISNKIEYIVNDLLEIKNIL